MSEARCEVCRRELAANNPGPLCWRDACKMAWEAQQSLQQRMDQYREFFNGRPVDEAAYAEYFELAGLEVGYQRYLFPVREPARDVISRRTYFHMNIGQAHAGWRDEFGRPFKTGAYYGQI